MIQARMTVNEVRKHTHQGLSEHYAEEVTLNPVYSSDPKDPNFSFSEATPSGELRLYITNKGAFGKLVKGKTYDINIEDKVA